MSEDSDDIWFHYRNSPGQFRGWPVSAKGWLSLIAVILGPQAIVWSLIGTFHPHGLWIAPAYLLVVIPGTVLTVVKLVKSKGLQV